MLTKILVDALIEDGERLKNALLLDRFPITAMFWLYWPESLQWRLIIGSLLVDRLGPTRAYTRLQEVLSTIDIRELDFDDISLLSPNDPGFEELRVAAVGPGRLGIGPAQGRVRNVTFQDSYIYRL
jgi:hypothetical protein